IFRASLVQHNMSMMRAILRAGAGGLLMATSAARAAGVAWDKLHAATAALYGECDLNISSAGRERLRVRSYCSKDDRTTFDADDYLVFTEYKNRERYHNGEKICPRPVRVDDVERVNRVTFTVFVHCEETGEAGGLVFKLEGDTLPILNNTSF